MKKGLIFVVLLLYVTVIRAQTTPWSSFPSEKKIMNLEGEDISVRLAFDTIRKNDPGNYNYDAAVTFLQNTQDLVGFGYKDEMGNPYGLWKYFEKNSGSYKLYCEGYLKKLTVENLITDSDISVKFPVSNQSSSKQRFINSIADKLFFTGEWRVYKDGRLQQIMQMGEKVMMPYRVSVHVADSGEGIDQLNLLIPGRRSIGNILVRAIFSTKGFVESIQTENINWQFDASGKPVIPPLPESK